MKFIFKIFGAPHIFDLYQGSENEISYFQTFDNGSRENVKFTIHRMASGQVSYTYLRYNFISGSSRTGAFFGMSVIFDNEYCTDIENLYELFVAVYETIPQNRILFEEINGNPNVQAKYLVRSFADADSEVRRIENIVRKNIENEFANEILPITGLPPVPQENAGLIVKLNDKKGNAAFLKALSEYSWVSISSEYKDEEKKILSPETIATLDVIIEGVQKIIPDISIGIARGMNVIGNIETTLKRIKDSEGDIKPYLQIQPELKDRNDKLLAAQKQLNDLYDAATNKEKSGDPPPNDDPDGSSPKAPSNPPPPYPPPRDSFWEKYKLKPSTIVVTALIGICVCALMFHKSENPPEPPPPPFVDSTIKPVNEGDSLLKREMFDEAIAKFQQAGRQDLITHAKTAAAQYWIDKATAAKTPEQQKKHLETARNKYPEEAKGINPNIEKDIKDIEKEIAKQIADAEKKRKEEVEEQKKLLLRSQPSPGVFINIKKSKSNKPVYGNEYTIEDELTVSANQNKTLCIGGVWGYENNKIEVDNVTNNPVKIKMKTVGKCKLVYKINGVEEASITFEIKPVAAKI
jgi:tetratricopeptide (TPR) repeat protein